MFKYSLDNKRYHTLNYFLRNKFGKKTFKVPLDVSFSCPNKKTGGCIFCKDESISNITFKTDDIVKQFNETKNIMERKWPDSYYIPYFQSGTNTYGPINVFKEKVEGLINLPNVKGISIGTRPDSINDEYYGYLEELNKRTFLTVELGLQSSKNETLKYINRGHTIEDFDKCVKELKKRNIFICVHIINGLPYETKEDMVSTVKHLNDLGIDAIKIHCMFINKGTKLEELYKKENFHILTKEEYIEIVCEQLSYLNENIVIERITGDPIKEDLVVPDYLLKKFVMLNDIDKYMVKHDIFQGIKAKIQ